MSQKYTKEDMEKVHRTTALDEATIAKTKSFGCFYCRKKFPANEVKAFIKGPNAKWAHCPKCGIDAVISDNGTGHIDDQLLAEMRVEYFETFMNFDQKLE